MLGQTNRSYQEMSELLRQLFRHRKQKVQDMPPESVKTTLSFSVYEDETLKKIETLLEEIKLEEDLQEIAEETAGQEQAAEIAEKQSGNNSRYEAPPYYLPSFYHPYGYYGQPACYQPSPEMPGFPMHPASYPPQSMYQPPTESQQNQQSAAQQSPVPKNEEDEEPAEKAATLERPGSKTARTISNIIFYIVLVIVVLAAAVFALSQNTDKSILGYRFYHVLTESMVPKLNVGDLIFVKVTDSEEVQTGDVITYNPTADKDTYLTHQVEEIIEDYEETGKPAFRTKGINNDTMDPYTVTDEMLVGTVIVAVPHGGAVMSYIRDNIWIIVILIVLISILSVLIRNIFSKKFTALLRADPKPTDPLPPH